MSDSFQSAYQEEEYRLERTMEEVDSQLERLQNIPGYTGHDFTEQVLEAGREERRTALSRARSNPISDAWISKNRAVVHGNRCILAKSGVDREEVESIRSSSTWRAPVASLFYHYRRRSLRYV